jgi:hypothetical protein
MKKVNKKLTKIAVEAWEKYEKKKEFKISLDWTRYTNMIFEAFIAGYYAGYNYKEKEVNDEKIS